MSESLFQELAVIGDAENDEQILTSALKSSGVTGFVGTNKNLDDG